ncbi:MAG: hypothetical protein R3B07_32165 [Polyangiaceae bacterium]
MPRPKKGTVQYVAATAATPGHYKVRVTCADGSRPWFHLEASEASPKAEALARKQAAKLAERVEQLGVVANRNKRAFTGSTVSVWFESWIAHREARGLSSTRDDRGRFTHHVEPLIGAQAMAEVSRKDIEAAMVLALDTKVRAGSLSWKTAANVWAVITKMFKDSVRSKVPGLRVREDNPCSDVEGPDRGGQRSKAFLFPTELLKFAEADVVPLEWRRLVAIAVYLEARASDSRRSSGPTSTWSTARSTSTRRSAATLGT